MAHESIPSILLHLLQFKCLSYFSKNISKKWFSVSSISPKQSVLHITGPSFTEVTLFPWKAKSSHMLLKQFPLNFPVCFYKLLHLHVEHLLYWIVDISLITCSSNYCLNKTALHWPNNSLQILFHFLTSLHSNIFLTSHLSFLPQLSHFYSLSQHCNYVSIIAPLLAVFCKSYKQPPFFWSRQQKKVTMAHT